MVEIMEFAHASETALQHFDIGECGNRLDIIRREPVEEPVHHFAPGPEIVMCGTPRFRKTGHAALEGVTVHIGNARNCDSMALVAGIRLHIRFDARDASLSRFNAHAPRPAPRQKSAFKPEHFQFPSRPAANTI